MASYYPPNYSNNNQFISTFNNINYIEPNTSVKATSNINLATLDERYLKKVSDDVTPYNLSVNNLSADGLMVDSLSISNLSADKATIAGTIYSNYKTFYNLSNQYAIYDFSDQNQPGYDYTGNARHMINNGPIYTSSIGGRTNAMYFNQSSTSGSLNQRLDGSSFISSIKTLANITMSIWVYPTLTTTQTLISFSNSNNSGTYISLQMKTVASSFIPILSVVNNLSTALTLPSSTTLTMNSWNHIVVSLGALGAKIYLNNALVGSDSSTLSIPTITTINTLLIGCTLSNSGYTDPLCSAYISDLTFWSSQLSTTEISRLYSMNYGYDVIALGGQSNMVGRASIVSGIDDDLSQFSGRVYQYGFDANVNSSGVVQSYNATLVTSATLPLDFISNIPGGSTGEQAGCSSFWKTFVERIINYIPSRRRILLVPIAKGGTGFTTGDWVPQTGPIYVGARNALVASLSSNIHPNNTLKAFLWHQGESDASATNTYGAYLKSFYDNICTDVSQMNKTVPFIMGEIYSGGVDANNKINTILKNFATQSEGKYLVSCSNLTTIDGLHFDITSVRAIGTLYGNMFIQHYFGKDNTSSSTASFSSITTSSLTASVATIPNLSSSSITCNAGDTFDTNKLLPFPPIGIPYDTNAASTIYHSYCNGLPQMYNSGSTDWGSTTIAKFLDRNKDSFIATANNTFNGTTGVYSGATDYFTNNYKGPWFKMSFPEKFILKYFTILGTEESNAWQQRNPLKFRLYGGNNNVSSTSLSDWTLIKENTVTTTNTMYQFWDVSTNTTAFQYYLMIVNSKYQLTINGTTMGFTELQLFGNPKIQSNSIPASCKTITRVANDTNSNYNAYGNSNWFKSSYGDNTTFYVPPSNTGYYLMNMDDDIICVNNTGSFNPVIKLLDSRFFTKLGKMITIKDINGNAGTYPISIQSYNTSDTIDGQAFPLLINLNYGSVKLFVSSTGKWSIVNNNVNITTNSVKFGTSTSTLSNYEEGTFSCSFINPLTSGSGTYSNNNCSYTRVGRCIYFACQFNYNKGVNTFSTSAVEIQLGSLPKPVSTRNAYSMGYCTGLYPASGDKHQIVFTANSGENIKLFRNDAVYPTAIQYDELPAGTLEFQFSGFYFV